MSDTRLVLLSTTAWSPLASGLPLDWGRIDRLRLRHELLDIALVDRGVSTFIKGLEWLDLGLGLVAFLLDFDYLSLDVLASHFCLGSQVNINVRVECMLAFLRLLPAEVAKDTHYDRNCDNRHDQEAKELNELVELSLTLQAVKEGLIRIGFLDLDGVTGHAWVLF